MWNLGDFRRKNIQQFDWQKNYRKDKAGIKAVQHLYEFITNNLKVETTQEDWINE